MRLFHRNLDPYNQAPNRTRKLLVLAAGALLLLITVLALTLLLKKPTTADDFLAKIRKGDTSGSYAMTSRGFKATISDKEWGALVTKLSKAYTGKTKKISSKEKPTPTDPSIIELNTYELQGDGGPYNVEVYLVDESDKSRISYFISKVTKSS